VYVTDKRNKHENKRHLVPGQLSTQSTLLENFTLQLVAGCGVPIRCKGL